jgi:hypothetical protein
MLNPKRATLDFGSSRFSFISRNALNAPFWFFQASVSIQLCVNEGEYSRLVAKRISDASGTLPVLWTDHGTRKLARAIVGIEVVVIPREDQDAVFWDVAALVWSGTAARIAIDNATYRSPAGTRAESPMQG